MTKQEFLDFASKQAISKFSSSTKFDRCKMDNILHNYCKQEFNTTKMLDFLCEFDYFAIKRCEKNSGDLLTFQFQYIPSIYFQDPNPPGAFYWEDIQNFTVICITVENCSGVIEHIYISEEGKFYNDSHKLIAQNQEELFDYIAFVEYDFHPVINEHTYLSLQKAGWFKGRRLNIENGLKMLAEKNIELTQTQQDFLREYGGLYFEFDDINYNIKIWTAEQLAEDDEISFEKEDIITVGIKMSDTFGLDLNGILYENTQPLGRTTMECINHLLNSVPIQCKYKKF